MEVNFEKFDDSDNEEEDLGGISEETVPVEDTLSKNKEKPKEKLETEGPQTMELNTYKAGMKGRYLSKNGFYFSFANFTKRKNIKLEIKFFKMFKNF